MRKKKKRGQQSILKFVIVLSIAGLLLVLALLFPVFLNTRSDIVFATEAWLDPQLICPTEWVYPEDDLNNPELVQALDDHNLAIESVRVTSYVARPTCRNGASDYFLLKEIRVYYRSDQSAVYDPHEVGQVIAEILSALDSTELSQEWGGIDMFFIIFQVDDATRGYWKMNYEQALRAHTAGLTGLELFELGEFR